MATPLRHILRPLTRSLRTPGEWQELAGLCHC